SEPSPSVKARAPMPVADPELPFVMDIDPTRVVLPQRVEDVPPPPPFIFKPLKRAAPGPKLFGTVTIVVTEEGVTNCRSKALVRRGLRVDVARCLPVDAERREGAAVTALRPVARLAEVGGASGDP